MDISAAFFIGFVCGAVIAWILKPGRGNQVEINRLIAERAEAEAKFKMLNDGGLIDRFKAISAELLESQKKSVAEEQAKTVRPVAEQMERLKENFDRQIKEILKDSVDNKRSFSDNMKLMIEQSRALQKEAFELTNALKNKKQQGNWGEFQLERIFEILGFEEGREYDKEVFSRSDSGAVRPDYVLNLPGGRRVIIDSKLSLESFVRYANAENDIDRKKYIKEFVAATKNHIDELSAKDYQSKLKDSQLDYVFMFMPLEHGYLAAMEEDPGLLQYAFKNNVALATPSLLFPMMRTVDTLLKIDRRDKNVEEVVDMVNKLYEKYVGFTESFLDVEDKLNSASKSYAEAKNRLSAGSGNMSGWIDKIKKKSGIASNKKIAIPFDSDAKGSDSE
ncbi:MAG: DNA recombination protein RmuC [Rickettsiales bacterium]|jgi:DNA recombination protein RmuC|nr:DNA recombination protein RmuC [Rickettsiales bacterium]